jgi:hypothetical protein
MSEKVVLPKEVANAMDEIQKRWGGESLRDLPQIYSLRDEFEFCAVIADYSRTAGNKYFEAVVHGYVAEKSPEEKVREYYEEIHEKHGKSFAEVPYGGKPPHYFSGVKDGIKTTLDILGIKIEGVNA